MGAYSHHGLFDAQTDIEVVKRRLRRFLHTAELPECRLTPLEERDWVRAWMDHFHPMRFGQRLVGLPILSGSARPSSSEDHLDPGAGVWHWHPPDHGAVFGMAGWCGFGR